jgi:hypothetical protein
MNPTIAYNPTAAEVRGLYESWRASTRESARRFDAYHTAKATAKAANDTGRILDEAIAARQAALNAYSVAWATQNRAYIAAAEAIIARDAANVANAVARVAYRDTLTTADEARRAHDEGTR